MGYGLDTSKYGTRKWSTTITWSGESKGKLAEGLAAWQEAVGVTFTKTSGSADFTVNWGGSACWQNNSEGNGKPKAGAKGILNLKESCVIGTVIHEIGHLLGLSHEQDHPDSRTAWYAEHARFDFELEGANRRAAYHCKYGDYDPDSVMHYPKTHYGQMTAPSAGDVAAVKALNGWS